MVIFDEISFASKSFVQDLERNLCILMQESNKKYGGLAIVFAGDYSQLAPVGAKPLYLESEFEEWHSWVHTFYELRTNHRFADDPGWGDLLANYRNIGPTPLEVQRINTRVVGAPDGPQASEIPCDVTYATKTNLDRMAINDGIFVEHLKDTHSMDKNVSPPKHTICIKASKLQWSKGNRRYSDFNASMIDLFHATVGEGHCTSSDNKNYDPMLKLYHGRPVLINENIEVGNGIANGTMCKFIGVVLQPGVTYANLERIRIDGYYVWCAKASQVLSLKVQILDGLEHDEEVKFAELKSGSKCVRAHVPIPLWGTVEKNTVRKFRSCRFRQFPICCANARTIHKLQGRSLKDVVISTWDYTGNWIYVALSRVKTLAGLYLRLPLEHGRCKPMSSEVRHFMEVLRRKGSPDKVELRDD